MNSVIKQTQLTDKEKEIVLERQNHKSISGVWIRDIRSCEFHHVVSSGLGEKGVGYEWNLVAITSDEHRAITDHKDILINGRLFYTYKDFITLIKNHLKIHYGNWSEDLCKVKKGYTKDDYGVIKNGKFR